MIPEFVDIGGPWKVLPFGIHETTLAEVEERYATNQKRKKLFRGLEKACKALKDAGCITIYLDGSFTTEKELPKDYDVCWNPIHTDEKNLDPVFLDVSIPGREKQKSKYRGEFFIATAKADRTHTFIQYFQIDKETGLEKGILRINL